MKQLITSCVKLFQEPPICVDYTGTKKDSSKNGLLFWTVGGRNASGFLFTNVMNMVVSISLNDQQSGKIIQQSIKQSMLEKELVLVGNGRSMMFHE